MKIQNSRPRNTYHVTHNKIFLVSLFTIFGVLFFSAVHAEDTTSTVENTEPVVTSTLQTSTTTIDTSTPTSTEFVTTTPTNESSTSTITSTTTDDFAAPTSTPTSTLEEELTTPTTTPTSTINGQTAIDTIHDTDNTTPSGSSETTGQLNNIFIQSSQISGTVSKILTYLKSRQDPDGKISDGTITDWSIMSFGANNQYADDIRKLGGQSLLDYEKNYNLDDSSDLNACASYPRHILALLSAGIDTQDQVIQGLKKKIEISCHENGVYGLPGINDDVFGLIALLAVNTPLSDPIIDDILSTIKADQTSDGAFTWSGWAGADITGAAINALKYAQTKGANINNEIFNTAKGYLKSTQLIDGGWGYDSSDIMTTSWVLMGINALHEGQQQWFTASGTNPWYPLVNQLKADGFYESAWAPGTVDWFAMKHAVPALFGKSWPLVMPAKVQNFYVGGGVTYIYTQPVPVTSTFSNTSTTLDISTTTIEVSTTTTATSTMESTTTTTLTENLEKVSQAEPQIKELNTSTTKQAKKILGIKTNTHTINKKIPAIISQEVDEKQSSESIQKIIEIPQPMTQKNVFISLSNTLIFNLSRAWKFIIGML